MSQNDKLLELLKDGKPHSTIEIRDVVYGGSHLSMARIGARVYDLKQKGHDIEGRPGKIHKNIWWYRMKQDTPQPFSSTAENGQPQPVRYVRHPLTGQRITAEEYAAL